MSSGGTTLFSSAHTARHPISSVPSRNAPRPRTNGQSRNTTLRRELLIFRPPLYSMKPSFRNLFMK